MFLTPNTDLGYLYETDRFSGQVVEGYLKTVPCRIVPPRHDVSDIFPGRRQKKIQLSSEERLALAKGVTFIPSSTNTTDFYKLLFQDMLPEVVDKLTHREIRYLELGCGVGGGLNGMLRTYPGVTAVAVDLAEDVLAEAQATAEALGHSERVTFIHDDARNFDARNAFDLVYWSQFFFPEAGRAEVLQVAYTALKPDGYLFAPLLTDPISEENLHSAEGRQYAMSQLMYGGWGIPRLSATEVKAEIEAAGFINVQVRKKPFLRLIVAQRSDKAKTSIMAL